MYEEIFDRLQKSDFLRAEATIDCFTVAPNSAKIL